jgi:NAD(P)-dependent dehydrogenase (short-subunit alcohol dehydrogenase family)
VVIGARNAASGEATRDELRAWTGWDNVDVLTGDLSSLASVRGMADAFRKKYPRLDVLINNAGVYRNERALSADGFELMFATNHLAPFLMRTMINLFSGAPEKAALGILGVALSEQFANQTGKFFSGGREIQASDYAHDRAIQERLWDISAKLVGM